MTCVFCEISYNDPHKQVLNSFTPDELLGGTGVVVIEPLNPCVKGHLLFIPNTHVSSIGGFDGQNVIASTFKAVNIYLQEHPQDCNIIVNNGADADQTVFHLHVHLIPRFKDDNVQLPWTYQRESK